MKQYICIDIDKGAFRYAVVSEELDITHETRVPVGIREKEELFGPLVEVCKKYKDQVCGVSITLPGVIDNTKGIVYSGGVYSWVKDMEYAKELEERIGLPVVLCNDAKAAALSEVGYGALKGIQNGFMVMILGGGIGGAVIANGKLLEGTHYAAGEFSYIQGDYTEQDSNSTIFARTNNIKALYTYVEEETGKDNMNIMRIMMGLSAKDEKVVKGVKRYCRYLASYIYNIQCVVDGSRVVIAGNITDDPNFMDMIKECVKEKFDRAIIKNIWEPEIVESCFHSHARIYGALYHYRYLMESQQ